MVTRNAADGQVPWQSNSSHGRHMMNRTRITVDTERCREAHAARQSRIGPGQVTSDRCRPGPGMPDAPPLVSRIAMSFWCQPTPRDSDGQPQANRNISSARRGTSVPTKAEQCAILLALALAAAAAILSAPDQPNRMHQISQWLAASTAAEAAASGGAIGEYPDAVNAP